MNKVYYFNNVSLVESLIKGDEKAFTYLIEKHHHELCVYANSFTKDIYIAEDIVQNVFIRIWEKRNRLNASHSLLSFLYKSVYNEFIDQYRKNQSLFTLEKIYFETLNIVIDEEDTETFNRTLELVNIEIQNLPPKCKEIFILSKKEGLTNVEIANYLKISIKTVEAQISNAFAALRSAMKKY
jgi:RNA polymerase sigma-70 factor (ECF subfamily)